MRRAAIPMTPKALAVWLSREGTRCPHCGASRWAVPVSQEPGDALDAFCKACRRVTRIREKSPA